MTRIHVLICLVGAAFLPRSAFAADSADTPAVGVEAAVHSGPVALLAATETELDELKKEVELVGRPLEFRKRAVYQARYRGLPVLLAQTGSTPHAAEAITRWLIEERNVGAFISIGPAGALSDELKIGEVVICGSAISFDNLRTGFGATGPVAAGRPLLQPARCEAKSVNTIVTVNSFVASAAERTRLREAYHAGVVDMSAAAVADACADRNLPCVIIREITDRADEDAPRAFAEAVRSKQPRTVKAALCALDELATDAHR